jgi:hypothetical protein
MNEYARRGVGRSSQAGVRGMAAAAAVVGLERGPGEEGDG